MACITFGATFEQNQMLCQRMPTSVGQLPRISQVIATFQISVEIDREAREVANTFFFASVERPDANGDFHAGNVLLGVGLEFISAFCSKHVHNNFQCCVL